jgi:tRNA(Ile)-lysidine synthase
VRSLAQNVLSYVRAQELLRAGDRVGVAVSGGIDSVALLRLLLELRHELGIVLSVVHFNHKLRGPDSDADQEFVAVLAREHGLEFYSQSGDVAGLAAEEGSGVEAAARELRYGFFRELLGSEEVFEIETEVPQGLKPASLVALSGAAEAAPFQRPDQQRPDQQRPDQQRPDQECDLDKRVPDKSAVEKSALDKVVTGHTLDDQAETVLMRVIRGTGLRGLGGIYPRILVGREDEEGHGEIVRPLLGVRRRELKQYLSDLNQPWREDSTNAETKFTRNRMRKVVLPLLEREFNPAVVESLSELAEIARDEEDYWENEISGWLGTVVQWSQPEWASGISGFDGSHALVQISPSQAASPDPELLDWIEQPGSAMMNASLSRPWLLTEPPAVQRRVVKAISEQAGIPLEFKHIEEILRFAAEDGPPGKELSLPLRWRLVREPEAMVFVAPDLRQQERIPDYEYALPLPGRARLPELGVVIEGLRLTEESQIAEYNPQQLLRADLLLTQLLVRNWRAGDRFWPAHTKAPKKIKELLQERHVTNSVRRLWPVASCGNEIVWMRGFPVPAKLRAGPGEAAVLIREIPWEVEESAT